MGKGWGYGKNSMSLADRMRTGKHLKHQDDMNTVYEYVYKDVSTYFKEITIMYIVYHKTKSKMIIIKGLHQPKSYDITHLGNQQKIFEHVANNLIGEYVAFNVKFEEEHLQQ